MMSALTPQDHLALKFRLPIRPDVEAQILLPQPMSEQDWEQMMTVLAAMKPGIVREAGEPDD